MDKFVFTLSGNPDGLADIEIPVSSFNFRHVSGKPGRLSIVIPSLQWADAVSDRPNGELIINWYDSGVFVQEVARANFDSVTPNEGARQASITLSGTRQTTVTPPSEPVEIPKDYVSYRSPNQTDGRWTYRLAVPVEGVLPTFRTTVGTHTFVVNEMQWQVSTKQFVLYIKE